MENVEVLNAIYKNSGILSIRALFICLTQKLLETSAQSEMSGDSLSESYIQHAHIESYSNTIYVTGRCWNPFTLTEFEFLRLIAGAPPCP